MYSFRRHMGIVNYIYYWMLRQDEEIIILCKYIILYPLNFSATQELFNLAIILQLLLWVLLLLSIVERLAF